jgi:hypothetical protein
LYSRLLEKMRLDHQRVFVPRYSFGNFTKFWLVLRGWLGVLSWEGAIANVLTQPP